MSIIQTCKAGFKTAIKLSYPYKKAKERKYIRNMQRISEKDRKRIDFYEQFIKKQDLCFDIGANMGNRSKAFLHIGAKVIAFEPQKKCACFLQKIYGKNRNFTLVNCALGESCYSKDLNICKSHTISSLSKEWIDAVKKSGRFSDFTWEKSEMVQIDTLDNMIARFGRPSFIKIDVEGFEHKVIKGLSVPIKNISIEFTSEFLNSTFTCLNHLSSLCPIRTNYSIGESMKLELDEWTDGEEMINILKTYGDDNVTVGDVYIKMATH